MTQRPVCTLAMLFGTLAVIGVLLPWHSHVAFDTEGGADLLASLRGYDGQFLGLFTLVFATVGTALLVWFVWRRTNPVVSRALLFGAALAFATGLVLTVIDFTRDLPTYTVTVGNRTLEEGRAFGMLLTLVSCGLALLMTSMSILSPKTPYRD